MNPFSMQSDALNEKKNYCKAMLVRHLFANNRYVDGVSGMIRLIFIKFDIEMHQLARTIGVVITFLRNFNQ